MVKAWDGVGTLISAIKSVPLIVGAVAGLFIPPDGASTGAITNMIAGNFTAPGGVVDDLASNYLFYSFPNHHFYSNQGLGVKTLVAGGIVYKILNWIV